MLYFAYGSNMSWPQMHGRCPSAKFYAIATLIEFRLVFSRYSETRKCGVADVVSDKSNRVWGVVYEIPETEIGQLDLSEGYRPSRAKNSYVREQRHVFRDGVENRPLLVSLYFATREQNPPLPNQIYKDLLLQGARYWHLPPDYVAKLGKIEVAG